MPMDDFLHIAEGNSPLILSFPHSGTRLDDLTAASLNAIGHDRADTDWHVDQLYADLLPDITTIRTDMHRYVIDMNRAPDDASLYPGQNTTGLCPLVDFHNRDIYQPGKRPDAAEIDRRRARYHAPYHAAIRAQITRLCQRHPHVILYDCHSIADTLPFLFHGILPDLNLGTFDQQSCAPSLAAVAERFLSQLSGYRSVHNGRFKGGWTTRHYGAPASGVHAIQMELTQSTYLSESAPPWSFDSARAERLRDSVLRPLLCTLLDQLAHLPSPLPGDTL